MGVAFKPKPKSKRPSMPGVQRTDDKERLERIIKNVVTNEKIIHADREEIKKKLEYIVQEEDFKWLVKKAIENL